MAKVHNFMIVSLKWLKKLKDLTCIVHAKAEFRKWLNESGAKLPSQHHAAAQNAQGGIILTFIIIDTIHAALFSEQMEIFKLICL